MRLSSATFTAPKYRRAAAITLAVLSILAVSPLPVVGGTIQASLEAGAWIGGQSVDGGPYASFPSCETGQVPGGPLLLEHRCAFEFDISGLPAGAEIIHAFLTLRADFATVNCSAADCQVDVAGYVGNGTGELADLTAGSTLLTIDPHTDTHDVTPFVAGLYAAGDEWGGFRLSRAGGSEAGDWLRWDNPTDDSPPTLVIAYSTGPTCQIEVSADGAVWVDDTLNVAVGDTTLLAGFDFPPNAEVIIEVEKQPAGHSDVATDTSDAEGLFEGSIVWEPGDEGTWTLFASLAADEFCIATVDIVVSAGGPVAPSPTGSATPAPAAKQLPDTATDSDLESASWLPITLLALAGMTSTTVFFVRRYAISRP